MVVKALSFTVNTTGGPHFSDVPAGSTFYPYIETLFNSGIVAGYADGTFGPNANVTRAQIAKIVVGAAVIASPQHWTLENPPTSTFADVGVGSTFFRYIETAASHNVVVGYACGGVGEPCDPQHRPYFRPASDATRGQASKIVFLTATYSPRTR